VARIISTQNILSREEGGGNGGCGGVSEEKYNAWDTE
jgi:hypothetical protein